MRSSLRAFERFYHGLGRALPGRGGGRGIVVPEVVAPLITSLDATPTSGNGTFEMGWAFTVGDTPLVATALRHWTGAGGTTRTLNLWSNSGVLLATVDVVAQTSAWASVEIDPVELGAGEVFIVSAGIVSGAYSSIPASSVTLNSAVTYSAGRYTSTPGNFPTTTHATNIYGLTDVVAG